MAIGLYELPSRFLSSLEVLEFMTDSTTLGHPELQSIGPASPPSESPTRPKWASLQPLFYQVLDLHRRSLTSPRLLGLVRRHYRHLSLSILLNFSSSYLYLNLFKTIKQVSVTVIKSISSL